MSTSLAEPEGPKAALLRIFGITALALVLLLALKAPASAQQVCLDRSEMTALLGDRYAENPVARGLTSNGRMVEIYASGDGATWTMIVTTVQGHSCVVASGEAWTGASRAKPDPAV
jgi:hypothetical protein